MCSFRSTRWSLLPQVICGLWSLVFPLLLLAGCSVDEAQKPIVDSVATDPVAAGKPLNVILIVVDTLRADHLGCYGYERDTSPFIDSLAGEGVLFERAFSQSSYTGESISGLFSGVPPLVNPDGQGWWARPSREGVTLPKAFKEAGYVTGHFANSPVMGMEGFSEHFDVFKCLMDQYSVSRIAPKLTNTALEFSEVHKDDPFFLYLHYIDPHGPYEPPHENYLRFADEVFPDPLHFHQQILPNVSELMEDGFGPGEPRYEDAKLRYDAEISFVDDSLRVLVEGLKAQGVLDHTMIVLTSDHGEEMLEHQYYEHAWTLYNEVLRVPLIFWAPDMLQPGRVTTSVGHADILPTLAMLHDLDSDPKPFGGVPLFAKEEQGNWIPKFEDHPLYAGLYIESRSLLTGVLYKNHKLIQAQRWLDPKDCQRYFKIQRILRDSVKDGFIPRVNLNNPVQHELLFNLKEDYEESQNLIESSPAVRDELRALLSELGKAYTPAQNMATDDPFTTTNIDAVLDKLKVSPMKSPEEDAANMDELLNALGYLGGDSEEDKDGGAESGASVEEENLEEKIKALGYF